MDIQITLDLVGELCVMQGQCQGQMLALGCIRQTPLDMLMLIGTKTNIMRGMAFTSFGYGVMNFRQNWKRLKLLIEITSMMEYPQSAIEGIYFDRS